MAFRGFGSRDGDVTLWTARRGHAREVIEVHIVGHVPNDDFKISFFGGGALLDLAIYRKNARLELAFGGEWIVKGEGKGRRGG